MYGGKRKEEEEVFCVILEYLLVLRLAHLELTDLLAVFECEGRVPHVEDQDGLKAPIWTQDRMLRTSSIQ